MNYMTRLLLFCIAGLVLYWCQKNGIHQDLKDLYEQRENPEIRDKALNRIESKIHGQYMKWMPDISFDWETNRIELEPSINYSEISARIVEGCSTPEEKAEKIYRYLTNTISYDTDYNIYNADECYRQKKGCCQAYCELFVKMGEAVGVNAIVVKGLAKQPDNTIPDEGHAWLLIEDNEGDYYFADPTWDAGSVKGNTFIREPRMKWFRCNPEIAIASHYPDQSNHQLTQSKISKETFKRLPYLDMDMVKAGVNAKSILKRARKGQSVSLPDIYTYQSCYRIKQMPLTRHLEKGKQYTIEFVTTNPMRAAVYQDKKFSYVENKKLRQHKLHLRPIRKGKISVMLNGKGNTYTQILEYDIR